MAQHVRESSFSPDGKLFALINEFGILKIWDTEKNVLKQEYTPNSHLVCPNTCLVWISISSSQKQKIKRTRKSLNDSAGSSLYLALGTSKGIVALYSFALAKVERTLKGGNHSGKITGITYDGADLLYTCGEDCLVIAWNIPEEKRVASWSTGSEKLSCIVCLPLSQNILVGAREIKLFSTETQELLQVFTGHTSKVVSLVTFTHGGIEYALSASEMERVISLWTLKNKSKYKNASCTFLMEDLAYDISYRIDSEENLLIAAVTRSGVIHSYMLNLNNIKADKPVKPKTTIGIVTEDTNIPQPIPAIAASFGFGSSGEILFGYGDRMFVRFERIISDFSKKVDYLPRVDPKKVQINSKQNKSEEIMKSKTPNVKHCEYQNAALIPQKKLKAVQMPMETRLQNLHLGNREIPQAKSRVQLLMQALHSNDEKFLSSVICTDDPKVIQLTLQKLPVRYISSFVNELTLLMDRKRSHVQIAAIWLKYLVRTQSSQLMALGSNDLLTKFGPCLGIIENRANSLKELSKLNGRLQLLVNQIKRNNEEDDLNNENVLVYEDEDSSVSDLEQEDDKSVSDDEWEENEEDEEMMNNE